MMETDSKPPRRKVLVIGAVGMAAGALAGCQVYGRADAPPPPPPPPPASPGEGNGSTEDPTGSTEDPTGSTEDPTAGGDGNDGPTGTPVAATSEVAVGGGVILSDQNLVITQPSPGEFKGFSAICTHQGCTVSEVSNGVIICRCHNSQFSIADGSVVQSASTLPAGAIQDPLPEAGIIVNGDSIEIP